MPLLVRHLLVCGEDLFNLEKVIFNYVHCTQHKRSTIISNNIYIYIVPFFLSLMLFYTLWHQKAFKECRNQAISGTEFLTNQEQNRWFKLIIQNCLCIILLNILPTVNYFMIPPVTWLSMSENWMESTLVVIHILTSGGQQDYDDSGLSGFKRS